MFEHEIFAYLTVLCRSENKVDGFWGSAIVKCSVRKSPRSPQTTMAGNGVMSTQTRMKTFLFLVFFFCLEHEEISFLERQPRSPEILSSASLPPPLLFFFPFSFSVSSRIFLRQGMQKSEKEKKNYLAEIPPPKAVSFLYRFLSFLNC